ncbi:MAG: hypothetical protein A2719_03480 [Candidatus Ryanbacteria bacterium RIFCSPHIGHO2_01_FULL_45_22]|uniref:Uncharacterized protein n=1 Tax=Candidatus Ryanbacteria bacterium RIFCSPHIGHO2_01_FULL_45_22 TaxID=1802114 RepID=A0A1G2G0Z6_9BACT|nr:MAG: hypothetical protein A2719_03480 [Candidatus Ryanbacteria bacterium RIFCSPHIGHO2_01_FULL_45_22]
MWRSSDEGVFRNSWYLNINTVRFQRKKASCETLGKREKGERGGVNLRSPATTPKTRKKMWFSCIS